jgi:hypothetical protein
MCKAAAVDMNLDLVFYPLTPAIPHLNHSHLITTHLKTGMYITYTSDNVNVFTMEKILIFNILFNALPQERLQGHHNSGKDRLHGPLLKEATEILLYPDNFNRDTGFSPSHSQFPVTNIIKHMTELKK